MSTNPYARYQEAATLAADPGHLVLMLYDGAIRACRTAQGEISERRLMPAHDALMQAQRIVTELRQTLDMSQGEVAADLAQLYEYILTRLAGANLRKEAAAAAEVQALLEELRGAWASAVRSQGASTEGR